MKIELKLPKQRNHLVPLALMKKAGKHRDKKREDRHTHREAL